MGRNRLGRLAVGIAIVAVACNGSTSATPSPSPSPTAAAASPSPSPSPAPSPSPTEVLPTNDVDDPVAALEAIVAYRDWLFENPDPDKLSLIYAERCECYQDVHDLLSDFDDEDQRARFDRERRVTQPRVEEAEGPFARVVYSVDSPPGRIIDGSGESVETFAGRASGEAEAYLVREGGRWRVVALVGS